MSPSPYDSYFQCVTGPCNVGSQMLDGRFTIPSKSASMINGQCPGTTASTDVSCTYQKTINKAYNVHQ